MWFHKAQADHCPAGRIRGVTLGSRRDFTSLFATAQHQTGKSTLISEPISHRKREIKMDWDRVEGNRKQIKGKVKEQ
jgi:aconitase B